MWTRLLDALWAQGERHHVLRTDRVLADLQGVGLSDARCAIGWMADKLARHLVRRTGPPVRVLDLHLGEERSSSRGTNCARRRRCHERTHSVSFLAGRGEQEREAS